MSAIKPRVYLPNLGDVVVDEQRMREDVAYVHLVDRLRVSLSGQDVFDACVAMLDAAREIAALTTPTP